VITFAGRITPEKGLAVLIEALAAIQGGPPIELRIAGVVEHDAYWSHCQRIQATATATNPRLKVTYLGHLDYSATNELFRQSDIVTIPVAMARTPGHRGDRSDVSRGRGHRLAHRRARHRTDRPPQRTATQRSPPTWPPGPRRSSHCCTTPNMHANSAPKPIAT